MSEDTGEFHELPGKMQSEWRISDFFSLPEKINRHYSSPKFLFADACWCLRIYPKGEYRKRERCIRLYLIRKDCGRPITLHYSFGIRKADGGEEILVKEHCKTFLFETRGCGNSQSLTVFDLMSRRPDLAPSGTLTVTCNLRSELQYSMDASLFGRLWNVSQSLRNIFRSQKKSDVVWKLQDEEEIPAHKVILQARSPVFDRMFDVDMRESQTGEVNVEDGDKDAFYVVFYYVYCGVPWGLSSDNACEVFETAHKYGMEELTKLCKKFMQESLSVNTVSDVIALADMYQETELGKSARNYLAKNVREVLQTEEWKTFKMKNTALVSELLEDIVLEKV